MTRNLAFVVSCAYKAHEQCMQHANQGNLEHSRLESKLPLGLQTWARARPTIVAIAVLPILVSEFTNIQLSIAV